MAVVVGNDATALQRPSIPCIRFEKGMVFSRSAGLEGARF